MSDKNIKNFCNKLANEDWESFMNENDTIKAYDFFYSKISTTAEEHFPLKSVKIKIDKRVPWMTPGLLNSKNIKNKLDINKLKNPTLENINNYKNYKTIYNKLCRTSKINFTNDTKKSHGKLIVEAKSNSAFYDDRYFMFL